VSQAYFSFHGELNNFLVDSRQSATIAYSFEGSPSVKHLIEALRVPHTEVGDIQVNGIQIDFSYQVQDGDQVDVYSVLEQPLSHSHLAANSQAPIIESVSFLLDNHLGKLATYLRILGFDASYRNDYQDQELARVAIQEERILLTRDRGLLMRKTILRGYCLRTMDPEKQLVEVLRRFDLWNQIRPFRRCLRCNSPLIPVNKQDVLDQLKPLTRRYYDEFHICSNCKHVYWKGSHYERMQSLIERVLAERK